MRIIIINLNIVLLLSLFSTSILCQENIQSPIRDLQMLSQNHLSYVKKQTFNKPLISNLSQKKHYKKFIKIYFSPWNIKLKKNQGKKDLISINLNSNTFFMENKKKVTNKWILKIKNNINISQFPNYERKAITISNTNIRKLPTYKPLFKEFTDHSNGFPFDELQNSALSANTPIFIRHITQDNEWVFIQSAFASGWIPLKDLAYTNQKFIKKFKSYTTYISCTSDEVSVFLTDKTYLYKSNIGMYFPLLSSTKNTYKILVAQVGKRRSAYLSVAKINKKFATKTPMKMTLKNMALMSNKLINQPYGWGGLYNNRDCSSMIRDLYSPFGIWLPRNSNSQAKHVGNFKYIANLSDIKKESFIKNNAHPYKTLLWLPGHIMIYIGQKNNKALVFHNIWGLRTIDEMKRLIIGKAVITTLNPGSELSTIDTSFNFLNQIKIMTTIN